MIEKIKERQLHLEQHVDIMRDSILPKLAYSFIPTAHIEAGNPEGDGNPVFKVS
jgi:hypothetical protein